MTKKDTTTTETKCYCEFCRKTQKHDISRDGVMMFYTCQVCGKSMEFRTP